MYRVFPLHKDFNPQPGSSPEKLYHEIRESMKPRKEELDNVCTNEELKLISQHYDVKLDMSKFNVLDRFYKIFEKRGSLKDRSKASTLRLLMRAYKRYKNNTRHMFTEQEITEILREEWEFRKSQTVRFLKKHSESSENENQKDKNQNNNNSNDNNDSNVSDESLTESEVTIIRSCPLQESEPIVTPEAPRYAEIFFAALNGMRNNQKHFDIQCTEDDDDDGDESLEQNAPVNSLVALEAEISDNVESEEVIDNLGNTDSLVNSVIQSQNTESCNSFKHGDSDTSTQGSQKPRN